MFTPCSHHNLMQVMETRRKFSESFHHCEEDISFCQDNRTFKFTDLIDAALRDEATRHMTDKLQQSCYYNAVLNSFHLLSKHISQNISIFIYFYFPNY